jgi:hypothetical protein
MVKEARDPNVMSSMLKVDCELLENGRSSKFLKARRNIFGKLRLRVTIVNSHWSNSTTRILLDLAGSFSTKLLTIFLLVAFVS